MKKPMAALTVAALTCAAYVVVVALTDRVFIGRAIPAGRERRAALALRDNVTPFQKWGSRLFTRPYLDRYYGEAWYFTQSDADRCKPAFLSCLDRALERYEAVDLFLLAHDNRFVRWVEELPPARRRHLRLVYNTGCRDLRQGPGWLDLGARAYVGHPGESASPVFYYFFLRRWTRGAVLQDAVDESNRLMRSTLARAGRVSFGRVHAARVIRESEAVCHGDPALRFGEERE